MPLQIPTSGNVRLEFWRAGITLWDALQKFAPPAYVSDWKSKSADTLPLDQQMKLLLANFIGVSHEERSDAERRAASHELNRANERTRAARDALLKIQEHVKNALHTQRLTAFGYAIPRKPSDSPEQIPSDVWQGFINWGKSEVMDHAVHRKPYARLLAMTALSFVSMYVLMYAMVNAFANVFNNVNQFYMAGLMTAAMVLIELALMGPMYRNRRLNAAVACASATALIGFFVLIQRQAAITDGQFLRSMIPHHASAILMCEAAPIESPQVKDLCRNIIASQQSEIDQMKALLAALPK